MNLYVINYAYPSSTQAKKLGFGKEGAAYLQKVIGPDTLFHQVSDIIIHTTKTVDEMIQYAKENDKPLSKYSVGVYTVDSKPK
jgi:hypothetical protein